MVETTFRPATGGIWLGPTTGAQHALSEFHFAHGIAKDTYIVFRRDEKTHGEKMGKRVRIQYSGHNLKDVDCPIWNERETRYVQPLILSPLP